MNSNGRIRASRCAIAALLAALIVLGGCASKKQTASAGLPTAEATYQRALDRLASHDLRQARELLQQIRFTQKNRDEMEPLVRLALADATFYQGTTLGWIDARSMYLEFVTLYGDHPLAPYAQLQNGMCSLKQVNHPSKDQTQTYRAIADLDIVNQRYPASAYSFAARSLIQIARDNLAESEFLVGRFYLKRKKYTSATSRFRRVLDLYPEFVGMDKTLLNLGQSLRLSDEVGEARIFLEQLVANHPDSKWLEAARKQLNSLDRDPGTVSTDVQ